MTKEKNDMTKEQQDLAWACLPKEVRDEIKEIYQAKVDSTHIGETYQELILDEIFGCHNLTSDTEPEEMLMVSRIEVQEAYKAVVSDKRRSVLFELFGDKCLPDKEEAEPKFPIGSIVRITNKKNPYHGHKGKFGKVITYDVKFNRYAIEGIPSEWEEGDLEPYTEENQESMGEKNRCEKCGANAQQCADSPCQNYPAKEDMEWKKPRMPKCIVQAQIRLISNYGMAIEDYECVEVEVSDIDLTQAAEAIREALAKFHQQKQKGE